MKTKVTFIADTHHFSQTLADDGRAYQLRSDSDQKCLKETGAIIDASFELIANSETGAVMIAGDVTNNGELASHEEFREKLYKLQEKKPVYLITATHDWCSDNNQRRFVGDEEIRDVEGLASDELRSFYYDFGPKQALSEYITHLGTFSYTVDLSENVRLLALNDDQSGKGYAGFSDEHFDWIEEQIKKATGEGKIMLGMQHHLIMPHAHPLISQFGMCVGEREYVASRLADAGLKYIFVGHSHIHRVSEFISEKGNRIVQVNVGSLVGHPSSIVNVTVEEDGKVSIDTLHAETFEYNGTQNTKEYLENHFCRMFDIILESATNKKPDELIDRLGALGIRSSKLPKLYKFIRPAAKILLKLKVKGAYRILNTITFGRVLDKKAAKEYWDKPVMDFVHESILNLMGGTPEPHDKDSAYCKLVTGVLSVPSFFVRNNKILKQLPELGESIVTGGKFYNRKCVISE